MLTYQQEIENIKKQMVEKFNPLDIILFGSCSKGLITKNSDIDICVITHTDNKRKLIQDILLEIEYEMDLDVIVYTPSEWERYKDNKAMFAHIVNSTGVSLIG